MNISIITVFPELYTAFLKTSLIKRAQEHGGISIAVDSFFSFVSPKERIDGPIFGHDMGMVLRPEVVERAISSYECKSGKAYKIFFSPQGKKLNQRYLQTIVDAFSMRSHIMLLPARYEGMDTRIEEEYADEIISIGDFVLMAGDLPALMLIESVLRLIPGVVGKQESIEKESFMGPFVDFPVYTQPIVWRTREVPSIVRSGNHQAIKQWQLRKSVEKTVISHFQWLRSYPLTQDQKCCAQQYIPPHYVVLMHSDVLIGSEHIQGTTSVTSIDIHDIARSCYTYGVKKFFIVTPLVDQQKIVRRLLDFWQQGPGFSYNRSRYEALQNVLLHESFGSILEYIHAQEQRYPVVISSSARSINNTTPLTFYDQERVWKKQDPILIVLGTGKGLSDKFIQKSDYVFLPIEGFSKFNHLSVRSAAAVILDRWLGINIFVSEKNKSSQNE